MTKPSAGVPVTISQSCNVICRTTRGAGRFADPSGSEKTSRRYRLVVFGRSGTRRHGPGEFIDHSGNSLWRFRRLELHRNVDNRIISSGMLPASGQGHGDTAAVEMMINRSDSLHVFTMNSNRKLERHLVQLERALWRQSNPGSLDNSISVDLEHRCQRVAIKIKELLHGRERLLLQHLLSRIDRVLHSPCDVGDRLPSFSSRLLSRFLCHVEVHSMLSGRSKVVGLTEYTKRSKPICTICSGPICPV